MNKLDNILKSNNFKSITNNRTLQNRTETPLKEINIKFLGDRVLENINDCIHVLNLYGNKDGKLKKIVNVFFKHLKEYDPVEIDKAFKTYIKCNSTFPTPSDIIGIIENRVKLDSELYKNLIRKRKDSYLSFKEENYIDKYEKQLLNDYD